MSNPHFLPEITEQKDRQASACESCSPHGKLMHQRREEKRVYRLSNSIGSQKSLSTVSMVISQCLKSRFPNEKVNSSSDFNISRTFSMKLRDCSLFMAKGGSVIFNQFRHMKNLPLLESGYFKKLPPLYVTGSKFYPPLPLPSGRDVLTIAKLRTTRVLAATNQNPVQGHL